MTLYGVPPRPARSGAADASDLGVERWACGVAASFEEWPPGEYSFYLRDTGLPVFVAHEQEWVTGRGMVPGDVGVCRRLAEVDGLVVCLLEISEPLVVWDLSQGRRCGLSVTAYTDPPPGGGPEWVHIREISLTSRPKDPLARVVSTGQFALGDWAALTGEHVDG